jgi:hypothetical protein
VAKAHQGKGFWEAIRQDREGRLPGSQRTPRVALDEAHSLGLDTFSLDNLDGPEPVLATMGAEKKLHQSGVSVKDHSDDEYEKLVNHGRISQWSAGKEQYLLDSSAKRVRPQTLDIHIKYQHSHRRYLQPHGTVMLVAAAKAPDAGKYEASVWP